MYRTRKQFAQCTWSRNVENIMIIITMNIAKFASMQNVYERRECLWKSAFKTYMFLLTRCINVDAYHHFGPGKMNV